MPLPGHPITVADIDGLDIPTRFTGSLDAFNELMVTNYSLPTLRHPALVHLAYNAHLAFLTIIPNDPADRTATARDRYLDHLRDHLNTIYGRHYIADYCLTPHTLLVLDDHLRPDLITYEIDQED